MCAQTSQEALEKAAEAKKLFKLANMNLREYLSNDPATYQKFGDDPLNTTAKFLGINWDLKEDEITIKFPTAYEMVLSKRAILKYIASLFDPCGPTFCTTKKMLGPKTKSSNPRK
jgi:hypothetical protein